MDKMSEKDDVIYLSQLEVFGEYWMETEAMRKEAIAECVRRIKRLMEENEELVERNRKLQTLTMPWVELGVTRK